MKCLLKYRWVKLMRSHLPQGKGVMGAWARLAFRAAFRKGNTSYCGYKNPVTPGMWSGGIVGLKSILGVRTRKQALETMDTLSRLGYIKYELDPHTKKLTYLITDWVVECSGEECAEGNVYATDGYGFLCLPRSITQRLSDNKYIFDESDAWLDLWCRTVYIDKHNAFSFLAPAVQYENCGAVLTLETLGRRWGWEKTKVWRFFKKYGDVFALYRLPGSYGCLVFNKIYPVCEETVLPTQDKIMRILEEIRILAKGKRKEASDHAHINKMVAWYSKNVIETILSEPEETRVALSPHIIRAYFSHCRNCKSYIYDCKGCYSRRSEKKKTGYIRGPCTPVDITRIAKELFTYEQ